MGLFTKFFGTRSEREVKKLTRQVDAVMALVRAGKGAYIGPESFAARYDVRAICMLPETEIALNLICLRQNRDNPLVLQLKEYLKDRIESK